MRSVSYAAAGSAMSSREAAAAAAMCGAAEGPSPSLLLSAWLAFATIVGCGSRDDTPDLCIRNWQLRAPGAGLAGRQGECSIAAVLRWKQRLQGAGRLRRAMA